MTWQKPPIDADAVRNLASRFDIDVLTAAILVRRNITAPSALPYYLEQDLGWLHDPFLFEDMADLVERIGQARDEEERVLVFGDRDVDGITSTAVLVDTLRSMNIDARWEVPEGDAPYGIGPDVVERAVAEDVTLIIAVDCGITNVAEIALAADHGIDTIIIDHHNPQEELPPAVAIINPKVGDSYPFQGLCACALAAKVRQALAFGGTELFGSVTTLLNARPANDTIVVDAILLENGLEVDRVSEALVPGVATLETSRLREFLVGHTLVAWDVPLQQRLLRQALGPRVDMFILDLADQAREVFPHLSGRSLLEMQQGSRRSRYAEAALGEIDTLAALYRAVVEQRFPRIRESLTEVLDLVAVATLADMMPISDENRLLVRHGLERLNTQPHPGMHALLRTIGLVNRPVVSRDVSWAIAPVINASGRMGTPSVAVEMLLSPDEGERETRAGQIHALNQERRRVGESAWKAVLPRADESMDLLGGRMVVVHDDSVHRGVTGIIAGRLSRRYNVPAAVLTEVNGAIVGSIRSARGFIATDFLQQFEDLLDRWGGHNQAAGFNLPVDRLDAFWTRLKGIGPAIELEESTEEEVAIDAELPARYLNPELERIVQRFEPYGQLNPQLRFMARSMVVEDQQIIGKSEEHVRLLLAGGGHKWPAVWWNAATQIPEVAARGDRVDCVFEFTRNHYNGNDTIQLVVIDLKRSNDQIVETQ